MAYSYEDENEIQQYIWRQMNFPNTTVRGKKKKKKPDTSSTWEARHLKGIVSLVNNVIDGVRSQVSSYSWEIVSGRGHKGGFWNLVMFCFLNQSLVNGQVHFVNIHHAVHLGLCTFLHNDINHQICSKYCTGYLL